MPDIPDRLPLPLSKRARDVIQSITSRQGRQIDYAIAGIPFLSAASNDTPFMVSTAQMQKNQIDTEPDPGEHTLTGWWIRSQASWHDGAGARYQEIQDQFGNAEASFRYYDSDNINPWTPGELQLCGAYLESTTYDSGATGFVKAPPGVTVARNWNEGVTILAGEGFIGTYTPTGGWSKHATAFDEGDPPTDAVVVYSDAGQSWFVGVTKSKVWAIPYSGAASGIRTFNIDSSASIYGPTILLAMDRLWITAGNSVFQLTLPDVATQADASTLTAWWSSADVQLRLTSSAASAATVYFGGFDGQDRGVVLRAVPDTSGEVPVLTANATAALLPGRENVLSLACLGGTLLGIGTNLGFRIADVSASGDLQYGPLCCDTMVSQANHVCVSGQFFYFAGTMNTDLKGVIVSVNAANPRNDGTYAWAPMRRLDHYVAGLALGGPTLSYTITDGEMKAFQDQTQPAVGYIDSTAGVYYAQSTIGLASDTRTGWVRFGRIRFDMNEPKLFKRFGLTTASVYVGQGAVAPAVDVDLLADEGTTRVVTYNKQDGDRPEVGIPTALGPRSEVEVKLTLRTLTAVSYSPVIRNYWVKAIPAVKPQRIWQVPVWCLDRERYRTGQEYGFDGFAAERLNALQEAENACDTVLWQDFRNETPVGMQAVIDKLQYVETIPQGSGVKGAGGILVATLRTLD